MPRKPGEKRYQMHFRIREHIMSKLDKVSRATGLTMTELVELGVRNLTDTQIALYIRMKGQKP